MDGTEEEEGEVDGIPFVNIERTVTQIRRLAFRRDPAIVHGTTGVGYELIAGLDGFRSRLIYGSHFWRDMFHGSGSFENVDLGAASRPEFALLCARMDQTYANSLYTRDVISGNFRISQPVVFPVPADVRRQQVVDEPGGYLLLMNGRPDKGLAIVLDIARRLPGYSFLVIASQASRTRVEEIVAAAGTTNVEVIDWSADTARLYRGARAVLVPSYKIIETFSRVTIEAQRYGVPVIGSDRGNVRVLLEHSGIALPEDAGLWAAEIDRLFRDDAYWRRQSQLARDNADRYPYSEQEKGIRRLVRSALQRIAVGVGSGIGDIVQSTPAIRRIAEHFGAPVDVLLRENSPGCRALLEGSPWVASVIPADQYASLSRFDAVLLFHCFGPLVPRFNAEAVLVARQSRVSSAILDVHQSTFNLLCAEHLLGVPFGEDDAARYFVGGVEKAPVHRRVGIHAGCKDGIWLAKRWPYFRELADRLKKHGFEVSSFGGADEYVEGTTDRTGTDLATTIRNIAACSYFVANDSGLMHVADGLGIPLTSIFAPTSPAKSGPLGPSSRVIQVDKQCSPCRWDMARMAQCKCIGDIDLATVELAVLSDLEGLGAAPGPNG